MDLSGIYEEEARKVLRAIEHRVQNCLLSSPGLAAGGTATNFQVSAFAYAIDGVVYSKGAANNIAPPGFSTEEGEYRKVVVCIDADGTVTTVGGDVAESQDDALLPAIPDGRVAVGVLELAPEFVSGTTSVTAGMCKAWRHEISV